MVENLTGVELQLHYKEKLGKKEKGKFLRYLIAEFDYSYNSIQGKLTGIPGYELNARDVFIINSVIREDKWRQ